MSYKSYLLIFFCSFLSLKGFSQKDEKRISAAKIAIEKDKDYEAALSLLGKVSEAGQKIPEYQLYRAEATEKTGDFDNSLIAYQQYKLLNPSDTLSVIKIADLQRKIDIRKKCTKCNGLGYTIVEKRCSACQGLGEMTIPCPKCNGQKTVPCGACDGTGRISMGPNSVTSCSSCGGSGKKECNRCNSLGTSTTICKYCKGGTTREKVKCTEHE